MRDESVALAHQRGAVLSVAAIATVVAPVLLPAIEAFRAQGHTARIRILDGSANEVAGAVVSGEADIGISSIPSLEPLTEFSALLEDRIALALPLDHPLAQTETRHSTQSKIASLEALRQTPLILPARGTGNRLLIDEAIARARVTLNWTYEVARSSTALEMVAAGHGAALVPMSSVGSAKVAVCTLPDLDIARPVGLLTRLGQRDSPAVAALRAEIEKLCRI